MLLHALLLLLILHSRLLPRLLNALEEHASMDEQWPKPSMETRARAGHGVAAKIVENGGAAAGYRGAVATAEHGGAAAKAEHGGVAAKLSMKDQRQSPTMEDHGGISGNSVSMEEQRKYLRME